jgi:pimeloyl-ACP methyl ester carboxylesterase
VSFTFLLLALTVLISPQSHSPVHPCKLPGVDEELLCGKLSVFENRQTRKGRKIELNVVVVPALEQKNKKEPLFELTGGPGVAATMSAYPYTTFLREQRRQRDIVLVDQRGTGASNPLQCDRSLKKSLDEMYPVEYVKSCRRKLERVADLTLYTTPIAMDDLDDVRAWLGYDKINLIGLSYGTRAALVYLRQHPERVRSAVLMGVAPTSARLPLYHTSNAERAVDLLFKECAANASCNKTYPNIDRQFREVLTRLEQKPVRLKYGAGSIVVEIRHDVFAEELRSRLYSPTEARRVPYVISEAAKGNFEPYLRLAIPPDPSSKVSSFIADGMYLSVTCAEDVPFIDPAEAERLNRGTFFGNYRVLQQRRACEHWPRGAISADYHKPTVASAPVLIIAGNMDPVTSPAWAKEVAAHLPNAQLWLIPHHAHAPVGLSNLNCLDRRILEFLDQPNKRLDLSCGDQMLPPAFFITP